MAALLALLSSALWGTGDFLGGTLSRRRPVAAVLAGTQVIGLLAMLVIATATRSWGADPAGYLAWGVLASVSGLAGLGAFYYALAIGRMGVVSPIAALGVLVPLAAGLLQGETPSAWQYLGIVLAVVGVVLASGPEVSGEAGARPVLLAVFAALMFGFFLLFAAVGSQESAVMTSTTQRATSSVLAVTAAMFLGGVGRWRGRDLGWLVAIGLFDVSANLVYSVATTMGLLAIVSVLGSLYPVMTVLLAWWLHHERLQPVQYVGVAVALAGVAAINIG